MRITINGVNATRVKKGITIVERKDEELDTSVIIVINQTATEYPPFSKVDIYYSSESVPDYTFLVDTDICEGLNKDSSKYYRHTLSVIEPTKILERFIVDSVAFTQPKNETVTRYTLATAIQRLIDITPMETSALHSATRVASIPAALTLALNAYKSPQFNIQGQNLRQAMDEMLKYINAISRVKTYSANVPVLSVDYFNKLTTITTKTRYSSYVTQNNGDLFAGKMDINLENGITNIVDTILPDPLCLTFGSEAFVMTTNDIILTLPKPIYAIKKIYMVGKFNIPAGSGWQYSFKYIDVDLTDYVYEEELFKTLPLQETGVPSQYGSLIYKKGDNKIRNFGVAYPQFWGLFKTSTITKIIVDEGDQIATPPSGDPISMDNTTTGTGTDILGGKVGFRIEYYPYVSQRITIQKQNPSSYTDNLSIATNQSGKALDVSRFITNAQGTMDRIGNGDLSLEKTVKTMAERFIVGQKTTDNYIVTTTETQIFDGVIKSRGVFTKNFNRLSQYISVDRDFRQYEIPLADTVKRNLIYSEYLCASTVALTGTASGWASAFLDYYRYMFEASFESYFGTVSFARVITKDETPNTIGDFILPISKLWGKNTNAIHFGFPDNIAGYYYPGTPSSTNIFEKLLTTLTPKRYTYYNASDEDDLQNGTFDTMTVYFIKNNPFKTGTALAIPKADFTEALAHYTPLVATYPNGLIYKLATPYDVDEGGPWTYVKFWDSGGGNIINQNYFDEQSVQKDVMLTGYTAFLNDQWDFLGFDNPMVTKETQDGAKVSNFLATGSILASYTDFMVKKDPSETISMTYQLHYVSLDANVILGETFAKHSPLMLNRDDLTSNQQLLRVWRSADYYYSGETKAKGTYLSAFTYYSTTALTNGFAVTTTADMTGYNSWAIGDVDGNLYFAVNRTPGGTLPTAAYFYLFNKLPSR